MEYENYMVGISKQILHGNFWSVSLGNKVENKPLTHFHITGLDKLLVAVIILIKNLVFSAFCQLFDFFWPNKSIKDDIFWVFFAGRDEKSKQNGPSGKSDAMEHFAVHNCVFTNRLYLFSQCRFKGRTEYYKLFWLQ